MVWAPPPIKNPGCAYGFYDVILIDEHQNLFELLTTKKKTVEPRELNFGFNMIIHKSVMCANFWYLTSRDRDLETRKTTKKTHFWIEN